MRQSIFILSSLLLMTLPTWANVVGSDLQNFNPTSDGLDFVTVHSARTLPAGYLGLGAFIDFASNPLPPALDPATNTKFSVNDKALSSDIHGAIGLTKDWEAGFNFSALLNGTVDNDALKNYFTKQGLTDVRMNTKYRFTGTNADGAALNFTVNIPQLQNDPFYGGRTANMFEGEIIGSKTYGRTLWGGNLGFRFRAPGPQLTTAPYEPVGNELIASIAAAYHAPGSAWHYIGELYGARPMAATTNYTTDQLTSLEALGGLKYIGFHNFAVHGGVAAGLMRGIASPDYRVYAGFNWYYGRLWGNPDKAAPKQPEAPINIAQPDKPVPPPVIQKEVAITSSAKNTAIFDREPEQKRERFIVQDINFDTGSDVVPDSFYPFLNKFADYLRKGSALQKLTIFGHTDSQGSAVFNQNLSQRRAEAVKKVLVERNEIPAEKIETIGMGMSAPIDTNETAAGRSRNRRVEFQIERE